MNPRRVLKLFNRVLKEFLEEYKVFTGKDIKLKITEISTINLYSKEVSNVLDKFISCDRDCIDKITLLKNIDLHTVNLDVNKKHIWKYIHNLYFISVKGPTPELIDKSKKSIENLVDSKKETEIDFNSIAKSLQGSSEAAGLGSLIENISQKMTKQLEGKDVSNLNPMDLITGIMSGNTSDIGGIDFSSIMDYAAKEIHDKNSSGEIDVNKLKEQFGDLTGKSPEGTEVLKGQLGELMKTKGLDLSALKDQLGETESEDTLT